MRGKVLLLCSLLLFCFSAISSAQVSKVSGIVISAEDNEPVVGASIMVKGTTLGTISDLNGKFSLTGIPSSAKSLEVSYLGMKTQVVQIKSNVKVVLEPDSKVIDEVVVTGQLQKFVSNEVVTPEVKNGNICSIKSGTTGISTAKVEQKNGAIYNVAGQMVTESYKGLVIKNGKKFVIK